MKIPIELLNADDVEEFLQTVSAFTEDVNLIQGSKIYDAKSLMVLMNMDFSHDCYVQIVTNSHTQQVLFAEKMQMFRRR